MDKNAQTEIEAAVFRRLLKHLDDNKDVQNIFVQMINQTLSFKVCLICTLMMCIKDHLELNSR